MPESHDEFVNGQSSFLPPDRSWPHHMLREIYEQPDAILRAMAACADGRALRPEFLSSVQPLAASPGWIVVASGSSRHAGLVGEIAVEDIAGIPVDVEYASEYALRPATARADASVIAISQSGETADTLAALRAARQRGHRTLAITNAADSSMAREAQVSLTLQAGRELAIPATKSFITQLTMMHLLALAAARLRGSLGGAEISARLESLREIPGVIATELPHWDQAVQELALQLSGAQTMLFLGRGIHYPIAREGALKLKEASYLHAEGYPTGELRHGPNALVTPQVPLVVIATRDRRDADSVRRYESTVALLEGLKHQGASVVALATAGDTTARDLAAHTVEIPAAPEHLLPLLEVVPLQLLAYFVAVENGVDVDRPRNLSKAVLAE